MTRANKALVVLVVAVSGLWGCAQQPGGATAERLKSLEGKLSKLEDDYRVVTTARDQVRKKLADLEEERSKLRQDLDQAQQSLTKEREDLKQQLTARTTERDAVQAQFESFRKGVRTLLNQADTASGTLATPPAVSNSTAPPPGNS
jgi:septal ring factor EnvC (AmiA/AmiB activator)